MTRNSHVRLRRPEHRHASISRFSSIAILFISLLIISLLAGCAGSDGTVAQGRQGHLKISGSTALKPLIDAAVKSYKQDSPQAQIDVTGGGSKTGLKNVTNKISDIGDSDIYADPALYPDPDLTDHIVCVSAFTIVTNLGVSNINSLTKEQIKNIFSSGKITSWKQVGGPNIPIVPIVRPATSGTRATFRKYILDGGDEKGQLLSGDSSDEVLKQVSQTPGAIGYLALSVVNKGLVHPIDINGVSATKENIAAGKYDFWSYEHMYTLGDDNPLLNNFLNYMLSPAVQQQAQQLSYIPINDMKLPQVGSLGGQTHITSSALSFLSKSEDRRYGSY